MVFIVSIHILKTHARQYSLSTMTSWYGSDFALLTLYEDNALIPFASYVKQSFGAFRQFHDKIFLIHSNGITDYWFLGAMLSCFLLYVRLEIIKYEITGLLSKWCQRVNFNSIQPGYLYIYLYIYYILFSVAESVSSSWHYNDVTMTTMVSQITSLNAVYSIVNSSADQRKHQSSASLAFVQGIHRDRWIPRTKSL